MRGRHAQSGVMSFFINFDRLLRMMPRKAAFAIDARNLAARRDGHAMRR
jgi:hypothetical protein